MKTSRDTTKLYWIVLNSSSYKRICENNYLLPKFASSLNHYNKCDAIKDKNKFEKIYKDEYYILKIKEEYKIQYEEVEDD